MARKKKRVQLKAIAKQLKDARVLAGMSSRQAGKLLGVSYASICQWENGKCMPPADRFVELLRIYGVAQHDGPPEEAA